VSNQREPKYIYRPQASTLVHNIKRLGLNYIYKRIIQVPKRKNSKHGVAAVFVITPQTTSDLIT